MNLRQLRYFIAIVDEGGLSAAARRLNVAQPALSQHVQRLEQEIGVPLLLRTARGVRATEAGRLLQEEGRQILHQVEDLRERLRRQATLPRGRAVVGIPTTLAPILTVPLVETVTKRFPDVALRIVEGLSGHMLEWLESGRVDFALVLDIASGPSLAMEQLVQERLFLVGPPDSPVVPAAGAVPFAALRDLPLILPGQPHRLRDEVESAARTCGFGLTIAVELDSLSNILALITRGSGHTVLSLRVVHDEARAGLVSAAPLADPAIERTIYLAHSVARPLGAAAAHTREATKALLAGMVSEGRWQSEVEWLARMTGQTLPT